MASVYGMNRLKNKYSSYLEYYIIRNLLIDNAFHYPEYGVKQLNRMLFKHCIQEIMFYRYKNVDLYFQGIKDFLKGPEWLMQQDGETLHQQVMATGYKEESLDKLDMRFNYPEYCKSFTMQHTTESKIKRNLTFNGLFFKGKRRRYCSNGSTQNRTVLPKKACDAL